MVVRRARMFPVECVVRGYLSDRDGRTTRRRERSVDSSASGLRESERLPEPIFTPGEDQHCGHDENISYAQWSDGRRRDGPRAAPPDARNLRQGVCIRGGEGLILADTKFEFGWIDGVGMCWRRVLTPTPRATGRRQATLRAARSPASTNSTCATILNPLAGISRPRAALPDDVVTHTREKYMEAFRLLTGLDDLDAMGCGRAGGPFEGATMNLQT